MFSETDLFPAQFAGYSRRQQMYLCVDLSRAGEADRTGVGHEVGSLGHVQAGRA